MEKYQFCQIHQEKVEFICRDVNTNELAGICLNCLPLPQGVPYESKKNVLINNENYKILMIKHIEEQKEQNVQILRKLIDYLNQYKKTQVEQIDQIIHQGEQEIKQIEKKCLYSQNQIQDYNAQIDVEQLKLFYNTLQNDTSLDQTQKLLLKMVLSIQQEPIILNSYKILQQFPYLLNLDLQNAENINLLKKVHKCSKHNQMIIGVNFDKSKMSQVICIDCIKKENLSFTKLEEVEKSWEEYQSKSKLCYQSLQKLVQKIVSQKQSLVLEKITNQQRKLEHLLINLENYKNSKIQELNQLVSQQINVQLNYTSVQQLEQLKEISKLSNNHWEIFEREIQKLHYFIECNHIDNGRSFRPLNQFINHITNIKINQVQQARIKYEQLSLVQQQEPCCAVAINFEGNILVAGSEEKINVFEFNSGVLTKLQQLDGHSNYVYCLQFMKNKDIFVSASQDKTIKIWKQQQTRNWSIIQTLEGHTDRIFCLVIKLSGDQIISGGGDKQIIFWTLNNQEWSSSQKISVHQNNVYCLCLNESENKLISCGEDDLILVMEQTQKNEWTVIQKIQTAFGYRLCFITDDLFSFQPDKGSLQIYQYNYQQKIFTKSQTVEVQDNKTIQQSHFLFPQKFIKSKQVLISKHKNYLNIVRRVRNEEFHVDQCVEFKEMKHYGTISDDGQYLVTWDMESKLIQVRNYKILLESN